jgi:glycosidase
LLYSPVIENDPYGPVHVNVLSQQASPESLWNAVRHMLRTRKENPAFGGGSFEWLDAQDPRIAAFRRIQGGNSITAVHNLSTSSAPFMAPPDAVLRATDILTGKDYRVESNTPLDLEPYQYLWLIEKAT